MVSNVSNSIFYSNSDNIMVINKEPLPNRVYKIKTNNGNYTVKVVGDKINMRCVGKPEIQVSHFTERKIDTEQMDKIVKWVHSKSPDVEKLGYMFENLEHRDIVIIKGYVQSGKTSFMLCSAIKYMFGPCSMSSIIVLRDANGDSVQIKRRLREMKINITEYLNSENLVDEIDITVLNHASNIGEIKAAMNGSNPKIFIVLGNGSQLRKLNTLIKKVTYRKYAVFIDEADSNDTGENYRKGEIDILKDNASKIFYISATILEIGLREPDIDSEDEKEVDVEENKIYMLQQVPNYMGIEKLTQIPLREKANPNNRKDSNPFENDPNIIGFVTRFEKFQPHYVEMLNSHHPQHCLISCGNVIEPQKKLFKFISSYNIAVILFNGKGVDLYHKSIQHEKICIKTDSGRMVKSSSCKWLCGAHSFGQSISVSDAIQWLKDNGGVCKFPRIITISGKLAGRGISFVSSDYGRYLNCFRDGSYPNWIGWRLTSMYYIPSKHTNQPNLMQGVGRVCCICRDNIITNLYACDEVLMDVRRAYWTQEELVVRARKIQTGVPDDISILEAMNSVKLKNIKLSKRRLTVNGVKRIKAENTLEWYEEDNGFDIQTTYESNNQFDKYSDPESWPTSIDNKYLGLDILKNTEDEITRLVDKMFKLWCKRSSTNISEFMHNLDPDKTYTKYEISELCLNTGIRIADVVSDKTGKSHKYGDILNKNGMTYCLRSELVEAYKHYF